MMQKDAEETAERDAMIEQQAAEQQARRDAELAARDEARRRLMHQVHNIRQAQIGEKFARRCEGCGLHCVGQWNVGNCTSAVHGNNLDSAASTNACWGICNTGRQKLCIEVFCGSMP